MISFTEDIKKSLEILRKGGTILYPTDTCWSIGCDATNYEAVNKILDIKQCNNPQTLVVLLENPNTLISYVDEIPDVAWDLVDFVEKPTTIIYDKAKNLAANLVAKDGSIGIRLTQDNFTQQLIQRFRKPLVCTSANIENYNLPLNFDDVPDEIKSKTDYVVAYRQDDLSKPVPSSIIRLGSTGLIKIIKA
jgi:L-threonylcarbamoyladenylate synthase